MPPKSARPAPRNYWQLPTFTVGVAAAVAAYAQFPPPPADPAATIARDATTLQVMLKKRPPDVAALTPVVRRVADAAERAPDPNLARFLAGSGFTAMADHGPAADMPANWEAAFRLLDAVDPTRLPDPKEDPQRLAYRRAKAAAAVGRGNPDELYAALEKPPFDEDAGGERPRLLAESALKKNPPDPKRARDELSAYLAGQARLPAPALAKLKLTMAQLCAANNDPKKAEEWLNQIGTAAPPDVQAAAKVQLARTAAANGKWDEAVKLYEAAQAIPELSAADRGAIRFQTGAAFLKVNMPTAAAAYFEKALADPGPVSAAAAVRLTEMALRNPDATGRPARAVELLEAAAGKLSPGVELPGEFVTGLEVRAAFEEAIQVCLNAADYPAAIRAVTAYEKAAPPGRATERRAEVNAAWAAALQKNPAAAAEAAAKLRAAADDYAKLAEAYPTPAGQAEMLRKAADCLRKAGDRPAAAAALDRIIRAAGTPAGSVADAWLDKGDLLLETDPMEAEAALRKAMESPGPTGTAARLKVGMLYLDRGREKLRAREAAEGQKLLELGQALLAQVANRTADTAGERDSQQQALYELGKLLSQQGQYADAEARFRQMIQLNPTGPQVEWGRLYLGSCLLLIARGDGSARPPADSGPKLTEAHGLFAALAEKTADPFLRTQAEIRLVNATQMLKRYDDLGPLCDKLAAKHAGKVEELIVLSLLYYGQRAGDRNADAARTLNRMEEVFGRFKDADFSGGADEYTKGFWEQWFAAVSPAAGRTQ